MADRGEGIDQPRVDGQSLSIDHPGVCRHLCPRADGGDDTIADDDRPILYRLTGDGYYPRIGDREVWGKGGVCRDRKSTRLNSSHVAISYAVFCLKKKIRLSVGYH